MNENLVGQILAKTMQWNPEDIAKERPDLLFLAAFKYDEYQPFFQGMHFFESLAMWLSQFKNKEERVEAYRFIKHRLIYISDDELEHCIDMSYPDCIKQILIHHVSKEQDIPEWHVNKILESQEFEVAEYRSIFLGLSDGAHIGLFRRSNPNLSNEQILRTHEIQKDRAQKTIDKLKERLNKLNIELDKKNFTFNNVFLLDDFSASGISYLRRENLEFKGKLANFFNIACNKNGDAYSLFDHSDLRVHLILYIATEEACTYLRKIGTELFGKIPFKVKSVCLLPDSVKVNGERDKEFLKLLEKYFDESIITDSYKKGKHDRPYLGFNECALPLILNHNTPNNSIPLLWFEPKREYKGIFPRVNRHSV